MRDRVEALLRTHDTTATFADLLQQFVAANAISRFLTDGNSQFGFRNVIRGGLNYNMELRWDGVPSLADGLRMLKEQAQRTPSGQWVRVVGGWSEFQFAERRMPTLDEVNVAASAPRCQSRSDGCFANRVSSQQLTTDNEP